ncbi:MAG: immunity protein Imm33 domain-containing protein [Myxococcaceae bacterium]
MPTLSYYCLIFTDGQAPHPPEADSGFELAAFPEVPVPEHDCELFGPHAHELHGALAEIRAAFLFFGTQEVHRDAGDFFCVAQRHLNRSIEGLRGFGLDVLKLAPFPLGTASELPEEPLAEDLFSVGFYEHPGDGFRAETFGLAKLGQREIAFDFRGRELLDEAVLMCARLADYALSQSRRVDHGQTMSFGFDRIAFHAAEGGEAGGSLRGWHPPFIQKVLPEALFPGVGLLEVRTYLPMSPQASPDLTEALRRSFEQRKVLEELELSGEAPHQDTTVKACACAGGSGGLKGQREDPGSVRDSGWIFTCANPSPGPHEIGVGPLGALAARLPQIIRYLSLPPGTVLEWHGQQVTIDTAPGTEADEDDEDSGVF